MLKLLEYEHIHKDGSCVIGEASFYLTKIRFTARRVKHMKKGNRSWFNWPSYCHENNQGKQWFAYGEFPKEDNEKIFAALKIEVDKFLQEQDQKERERLRAQMEQHESNPTPPDLNVTPSWASHYFKPDYDENAEVPS